ncbi:putative glycolipid-binding domain-containing protein [Marinitenerispora sediminis]|uniref:Glycolipid-binding family protein n=1 Tax=Marinitenerispora sediminis TaxID=1931232 RepID=A0A368T553_9ACTN|nr:putative glycolipid-binding domain-containing protein [Marinitenerispora sediminis]RCV48772.1 glycolipid-binding family protein [Marinitenerispora sediminis]RCV50900.1 glycolipid-binding family protein [Marinitenerispora sediminis]RCV58678.1 glycolipid-binding family protein [Marinitenerispora sediminis]
MSASNAHVAAWSRIDVSEGLGMGSLIAEPTGFRLEGSEVVAEGDERYSCRFTVTADLAWRTRVARVEVVSGNGTHVVELAATSGGHWTVNGHREPALDGCVDVDVAATPVTNTLPIRRLGLAPGEYRDLAVAWVDVPSLQARRLTQRYIRLTPTAGVDRYEYIHPPTTTYTLTVDAAGLVIDYERFARRVR